MNLKNYLFRAVLLLCVVSINAQDNSTTPSQNFDELKINGLYLVIGAFDVTYERTLNEESGLGINVFLPFDEDIKDDIQYYISPYYRMYFGKKHAAGFFVEGFGMLNSIKEDRLEFNQGGDLVIDTENVTDFALGIGVGGKWVTNRGFLGEIGFGVGRNLFNSSEINNDFVGKFSITIGYRF